LRSPQFDFGVTSFCGAVNAALATKSLPHVQARFAVVWVLFEHGGLYVSSLVSVVLDFCAGALVAFCLVKLTCQFGDSILVFVEHFFR
jgi:hypothetical protein